jgi:hypothetical protein
MKEESSGTLGLRKIVAQAIKGSRKFRSVPKRITPDFLARLVRADYAFTASRHPIGAAEDIRKADGRIVILPLEFRVDKEESDRIVKSATPRNYLNLNSAPVVRDALELARQFAGWGEHLAPSGFKVEDVKRLTDKIAEMSGMYPYFLIRAATERKREGVANNRVNPPIGFYWTAPNDRRPHVVTWMRAIKGHELFAKYRAGEFPLELGKEIYAKTIKATVPSQSHKGKVYDFWLVELPAYLPHDRKQHSGWRRLETSDNNPDAGFRGLAHRKRKGKSVFFTAYSIAAYDAIAVRIRETREMGARVDVQVNPFPLLTPKGRELVRTLRENTIVAGRGLNVSEMDGMIGIDTAGLNSFDYNFTNWTRTR